MNGARRRNGGNASADGLPPLTRREREVLHRVAWGLPNKDVARALGLSVTTVRNHVHNILDKLGVHSKLAAVSLAFRNRWIDLDDDPARPAALVDDAVTPDRVA